jgi:hypothetical protein
MNAQCQSPDPAPRRACCPVNGKPYQAVPFNTVLHQVQKPWARALPEQGYYFCTDPDCEVVYFGEDERLFTENDLRIAVGQKSRAADRAVCYCFDITRADIERHAEQTRAFVTERTRDGSCDCQVRNPSGQCCLKDFPK